VQRVAIVLCLGQPADIYLIDEPSAYLDSEQRIMASKVGVRHQPSVTGCTSIQLNQFPVSPDTIHHRHQHSGQGNLGSEHA
jgi:ABC-type arginine transport system ATPase subunit